jgi:Rnl2 family RNA ligase
MEKYPSIVQLPDCPEIFHVKEVVATEKLHGSNFRLSFPLGMKSIEEVGYGSRDLEYGVGDQKFPLGSVVNKFKAQTDLLNRMLEVLMISYGFSEVTVFGEAYGPGIKAKGVRYSTGQEPLFRAFDIMVAQNFVTYDLFCEICDKIGLPRVHEVWRGEPTQANFDALLEKPSTEGLLNGFGVDNISEGVVLRSNPLFRNVFGEWLICKHKCAKFAEVAQAALEKIPRGPTAADDFAAKYVTEGRVINAIGRLHDSGIGLSNTMKDMPTLLVAVCSDLAKDYPDEMVELGITESSLKGNVSRILGPMYRELLSRELQE